MTLGFTAPEVGVAKASAAEEMTERKKVCTKSAFVFVLIIHQSVCQPAVWLSVFLYVCLSLPVVLFCVLHKSDVAREVRS